MSQGQSDYNSSRGHSKKIEEFYDVGSRLTADACGAGGEVMRGYGMHTHPPTSLTPERIRVRSQPLLIDHLHHVGDLRRRIFAVSGGRTARVMP